MRNRKLSFLLLIFIFFTNNLFAEKIVLKCVDSAGGVIAPMTIDTDKMIATWDPKTGNESKLKIDEIDQNLITLIDAHSSSKVNHGGEIWVIDRFTGEFANGGVGLFCKDQNCISTRLNPYTQHGKCTFRKF